VKTIEKAWGREEVWADTPLYTGKFLHFDKGATGSAHFHGEKDESWFVQHGAFLLYLTNPTNGHREAKTMRFGDTIRIAPLTIHQMTCLEAGTIIEVSTPHRDDDTYRVSPSSAA
jgi:oxalate decarboxylase/phosphoglucose isomerase-like protein (cupin superfamily)